MHPNFFFSDWASIFRILFVGTFAYLALLATLRIAGPRTIAKTNLFDFIVAVAVGSVFGRIVTAKEVALVEAVTAFALLAFLQFVLSRFRIRYNFVAALVDGTPRLLYFGGSYLPGALEAARLQERDVEEVARTHGFSSMEEVAAVVLEAGGDLSVLRKGAGNPSLVSRLI